MDGIFKLLLFFIVSAAIAVAGFKAYQYFNQKIIASSTAGRLLLYATLLIVVNSIIIWAGVFILFKAYELLADV
jgi:hypothetical protein